MADTGTALAVIPANGVDTYRMSTDAAHICGEIVKKTARDIQGRKYVQVEGWQAIAVAHGCAASSCNVERVEGGFKAVGQVRRMDTGTVIAEAEGFVGEDEPVWFGGETIKYGKKKTYERRPDYAIRAMAQTRAISRACRSAFAHVVVMIDASLATTPAEEMPWDNGDHPEGEPPNALHKVDPADRHLIQGDGRSTYDIAHESKSAGRLNAELLASAALGVLQMPGMDLVSYNEWKAEKCTPKGTKTNGDRLDELREKHPDLAQKIDEAADNLRVAA